MEILKSFHIAWDKRLCCCILLMVPFFASCAIVHKKEIDAHELAGYTLLEFFVTL
jgi:hypothetical protein